MGNIVFYTYCPGEGVVKIHFAGTPPLGSTPGENRILLPIACTKTRTRQTDLRLPYKLRRIYSYRPYYTLLIPKGAITVNMSVYSWVNIGWTRTWREYTQRSIPFTTYRFPAWNAPVVQEDWQNIPNLLFVPSTMYTPPFIEFSNPRDQNFFLHVYLVIYKASQSRFLYFEYFLQGPKRKTVSFKSIREVMMYWKEVRETLLLFHDTAINGEEIAIYPHPLGRIKEGWKGQYRVLKVINSKWLKGLQVGQNYRPAEPQNYYRQFVVQDGSKDAIAVAIE
jgi:hypothetical protein